MMLKLTKIILWIVLFYPSLNFGQGLEFVMDMVHNNPGEAPFVTKYNDPVYLKSQGFNATVVQWHVQTALTYDGVKKYVVPINSDEREWIEQKRANIGAQLKAFETENLNVFAFTDFLVFPKSIWKEYGDQISASGQKVQGTGGLDERAKKPDIQKPITQKLLIAQIDEIFKNFPELDGIVLRFGETYLHDTPYHLGGSPINNHDSLSIPDHILLINILREEICVKRNKKLFYRTWDFGYRFHNNPDYYLAVTNAIETHPNLFFSIKYQQGDFHRMVPFNPSLGKGKHRQIVESQSRMEAYGKCAYPYYTASGVINGWPETKFEVNPWSNSFTGNLNDPENPRGLNDILDKKLLAGVMTWSHGGGWQGPYIKHEIWTDLNTYVVANWAHNPKKSEVEIFSDFTKSIGLNTYNSDLFRQIALLSIEGVRKGHCSSYTSNSVWWTRDEFFSVKDNNDILRSILEYRLEDKVLSEKAEASAIWLQIEAISREIEMDNLETLKAIRTSCTYGRIMHQLIEQMWALMIEDATWSKSGTFNREKVSGALNRYDELWNEWKMLEQTAPYCASIYTDMAFSNQKQGSIGELVSKLKMQLNSSATKPTMLYGDITRLGRPFAKDPHVIYFNNRYLMYYSVPGYTDQQGILHGWGIGVAESSDLLNWKRVGEVNTDPDASYEAKGFAAPCALVVDGKVNLFYQTYGNWTNDAICHAWSTDGLHFTRNTTNPIFKPNNSWNAGRAIDAEVIWFKGNYYLYYATRDPEMKIQMLGVAKASGNSQFNKADWMNITVDEPMFRPELEWERNCIEAASIITKGDELYMFYAGGYNNAPQQIGVAKSTDGVHWTRLSDHPFLPNGKSGEWNSSESGHPHIFDNPNGDDYLFFQGNKDVGFTWFISNKKISWNTNGPSLSY